MKFLFQITLSIAICCMAIVNVSAQTKTAKKLPDFKFFDLKGNVFGAKQISYDKYLTVVYFDPSCEHCEKVTKDIVANINKFKNTKMVWVSFGDAKQIAEFQNKYFKGNKNVIFLHDKNMKIFDFYPDAEDTPTIYIYDKNKNQVAKLGESPAKDIYKYYK